MTDEERQQTDGDRLRQISDLVTNIHWRQGCVQVKLGEDGESFVFVMARVAPCPDCGVDMTKWAEVPVTAAFLHLDQQLVSEVVQTARYAALEQLKEPAPLCFGCKRKRDDAAKAAALARKRAASAKGQAARNAEGGYSFRDGEAEVGCLGVEGDADLDLLPCPACGEHHRRGHRCIKDG